MQMRPPSLYLAQSIRINDGQDEATVGVSGVEITVRFFFFKFLFQFEIRLSKLPINQSTFTIAGFSTQFGTQRNSC